MMKLTLKSGKMMAVSSLNAIEGTVWVKKIDYKRSNITPSDKKKLLYSLVEAVEKYGVDKSTLR